MAAACLPPQQPDRHGDGAENQPEEERPRAAGVLLQDGTEHEGGGDQPDQHAEADGQHAPPRHL